MTATHLHRKRGCMVSGMAPILAPRTDGPGQGASHGLSRSPWTACHARDHGGIANGCAE